MITIGAFFLQIRALFPNFRKGAGETSPPFAPLVTRLFILQYSFDQKTSLLFDKP